MKTTVEVTVGFTFVMDHEHPIDQSQDFDVVLGSKPNPRLVLDSKWNPGGSRTWSNFKGRYVRDLDIMMVRYVARSTGCFLN